MPWRCTFLINIGRFGISETYYRNEETLDSIADPINLYIEARNKLLPAAAKFAGLRISKDGSSRRGQVFTTGTTKLVGGVKKITLPDKGAYEPKNALNWDQNRAALLCALYVADVRVGMRYLAPIPDALCGADEEEIRWVQEPLWESYFDAWRNHVVQNNWGVMMTGGALYQIGGLDPPLQAERDVVRFSIGAAAPNNLQAELAAADALTLAANKDKIVIRNARMRTRDGYTINGPWRVGTVTAPVDGSNQLIELLDTAAVDTTLIKTPGKIRVFRRAFVPISLIRHYRIGIHDRGGPFFQTVGRDKPKRPRP